MAPTLAALGECLRELPGSAVRRAGSSVPLSRDAPRETGLQTRNVDDVAMAIRRIAPAHHLQPKPLGLGEATPHPIGLMCGERVGGTLRPNRAVTADLFGRRFTPAA